MDHFAYRAGRLFAEDVDAEEIARRFGTPAYVYSKATLLGHLDRLRSAMAGLRPMVCFAVKSCGNVHVLRLLVEAGSGLDIVSAGELARADAAGCPRERVVFAGVGKSDAEIAAALGRPLPEGGARGEGTLHPVHLINVESPAELDAIASIAGALRTPARLAIRVNPGIDPGTHDYTATGRPGTKFGVPPDEALRLLDRWRGHPWARVEGLHLHLGSSICSPAPYVQAVRLALDLIDASAARGVQVRALDIGGGFGADYESGSAPPYTDYAAAVSPLLRDRVERGLEVIIEPGRTISANAGVLLTRVHYVKESGGRRFVICDAGMHTLIRPALYGAFHFVWPARVPPALEPAARTQRPPLPGLAPCDVVGPVCETGDFLARDRLLPPVARGDLLAVFGAGAYGFAMASNYNSHPLPAEVLVDGAEFRLVRRRQSLADLLEPELALPNP